MPQRDLFDAHWTDDGFDDGWQCRTLTATIPGPFLTGRWSAAQGADWLGHLYEALLSSIESLDGVARSTPFEVVAVSAIEQARGPSLIHLRVWWNDDDAVSTLGPS